MVYFAKQQDEELSGQAAGRHWFHLGDKKRAMSLQILIMDPRMAETRNGGTYL